MNRIKQKNPIIRISLTIKNFKGHPNDITKILGITPSRSGLPGHPVLTPNGRQTTRTVANPFWSLQASSDHYALFEDQLEDLLRLVLPFQDAFNNLPKDVDVTVRCTVFPEGEIPLFRLKPDIMKVMSAIGATFVLDIDQSG